MSQLNLQQILSGDNISELVDKLNYNFDQIVLNGGGPQGLRGIIGPPGLPGSQGDQGVTGPTGADGTYLYGSDVDPDSYAFGASGENLPRERDLFLEAQPTYINVWQLGATGWNLIETVQSPSSGMKLVYDGYDPGGTSGDTSNSNDPSVAGKFLYGSVQALNSANIIDPSYNINSTAPRRVLSLSSAPIIGNDSLVTLAAQSNQLRILTSSDYLDWSDRIATGGGILHSMEVKLQSIPGIGATHQIYKIAHADVQGNKHLVIDISSISGSNSTLIYGDEKNRLVVGGDELERVVANFNARNSGAIGSANFYAYNNNSADPSFENSIGVILQGNLSIGRNKNTLASISAFSDPIQGAAHATSYPFGTQITRILADVNRTTSSPGTSTAFSEIALSVNAAGQYFDGQTGLNSANWWRFTHDGRKHITNSTYGYLRLLGTHVDLLGTANTLTSTPLTVGVTAQSSPLSASSMLGINNENPYSVLDVGFASNRISLGQSWNPSGVSSISYIGFNAARSPLSAGSWIRRASGGASGGNSGNVIWKDITDSALLISFFDSGSTGTTGTMTDTTVYAATRTILKNGSILTAEQNRPDSEGATSSLGLYIGFGASGTTGSGFGASNFRRYVSIFGRGITSSSSITPMISTTNGLTGPSNSTEFPQYSFYGANTSGLYYGLGFTANGGTTASKSLGLSLQGYSGVSIHYLGEGSISTENVRVGISQAEPLDRVHIGKYLTIHEGNESSNTNQTFIGHNLYYDVATNSNKRIYGASASWRGASRIVFDDTDMSTAFAGLTGYNSVNRFTSIGSKVRFDVAAPGPTGATYDINQWNIGYTQRSVVIQPPPIGPTATQPAGFYAFQTQVPQMTIGLKNDAAKYSDNDPSGNTAKRGTLSLAAQMRVKPLVGQFLQTTIEDKYNIGLYSYDGYPVGGIYSSGGDTSTMLNKTLGFSMLGDDGDAVSQDVSLLEFKVLNSTISDPSAGAPLVGRVANFGPGVRVGMGPNVSTSVLMNGLSTSTYDNATLSVEAIETGTGANDRVAAYFRSGSVVIDMSNAISSGGSLLGGNMGLIFKDAGLVNSVYPTVTVPNPSTYRMDWGIQYTTAPGATGNLTWGGLNFGKAGDSPSKFGFDNYILWLNDNGNIGVGTGSPRAKLHVNGGPVYGSSYPTNNWKWFSGSDANQNTLYTDVPNGGWAGRTLSIYATNDVWANFFLASSDLRIKDVQQISTASEDLESIKKIQVTDYKYKDVITNGDKVYKKLIAQNIKEVLPNAVSVSNEFIPDIYEVSTSITRADGFVTVKVTKMDLQPGDRVKLILENESETIVEITGVDIENCTFSFKSDDESSRYFVYGKEVDDFLAVDYDAVFSMHISATQQLCKIVDEKDEQIKKLEDRLSKIEELLTKNNIL